MAWNVLTCPSCLSRFGASTRTKAIDRLLTDPRHACLADVLAGHRTPYNRTGTKR